MRGVPWKLLAAAGLTAVLLDLPFPLAGPMPAWRAVFAWFALVPLVMALMQLPIQAPERRKRWQLGWSFLSGWFSGALWFGLNCYWVYGTMHVYGGMSTPVACLSMVLFSLYLGFWCGLFGLALGLVRRATLGRKYAWLALASVPFLWTAMEYALAQIPKFPWDLLGYSQVDNPLLMRLVPWTGVYGISFLLVVGNTLLVAGFVLRPKNRVRGRISGADLCVCLGVVMAVATIGIHLPVPKPSVTATAVLVQPNLDVASDDVWVGPEWDRQIAQFKQLGSKACGSYIAGMPETGAAAADAKCEAGAAGPVLIAWPESPAPFREPDVKFRLAMGGIVAANKAPMVVGNVGMDVDPQTQDYRIYNSASVVAMDGRFIGRYDKIHLVPFGEYVPLRRLLFFAHQIAQTPSDLSVGTDRKVFRIGSANGEAHRYGVFICYESVFGDEIRQFARLGGEVLVNISDDGWYGDTSAPWQHLNMARMRAIENRRWILRDTNNGVTAAIDPYGVVRQSIPRHQVGALAAQFGYSSELTFYTVHGDWLAGICAILGVALVVWSARRLLGEIAGKGAMRA